MLARLQLNAARAARLAPIAAAAFLAVSCGGDKVRATEWKYFEKTVEEIDETHEIGLYVAHAFQASPYDPSNPYARLPTICARVNKNRDGTEARRVVVTALATHTYGEGVFHKAEEWEKRCGGEAATDSIGRPIEIRREQPKRG